MHLHSAARSKSGYRQDVHSGSLRLGATGQAENGAKVDRCFVLSTNNVEVANGVTYLPLYMASLL
ncbi:MAG: hypothetical protein ACI31D_01045 [Candidatus Limisoma sp.]